MKLLLYALLIAPLAGVWWSWRRARDARRDSEILRKYNEADSPMTWRASNRRGDRIMWKFKFNDFDDR